MSIPASDNMGTALESVTFLLRDGPGVSISKSWLVNLFLSAVNNEDRCARASVDGYFITTTGQISEIGIQIKEGRFTLTAFGEGGRRRWTTFDTKEFLDAFFPSGSGCHELRNKLLTP